MAQMSNDHSLSDLIYGSQNNNILTTWSKSSLSPYSNNESSLNESSYLPFTDSRYNNKNKNNNAFLLSDVNPISNEMRTGTTICAITYKDGVIVGADSRSSAGSYVANRLTDKLHPLTNNIFILRSGASAHTQNIGDYVQHYLNIQSSELDCDEPRVKTAAQLISSICYSNKKWVQASIMIAGYDKIDGGTIYTCPLGGTLAKKVPYDIGGSGSAFIYGFCDEHFKPNMEKDDALLFIRKAISHAIHRDGSSGGVIRTCVINKDGLTRETVMPFTPEQNCS